MLLGSRVEMLMGVVVKGWCGVFQVSFGVFGVLNKAETEKYHHSVTLASGGMGLRSWALAAKGGRL